MKSVNRFVDFWSMCLMACLWGSAGELMAQTSGINHDPYPQQEGKKPYEMSTRTEERKPLITFEDCTKWTVEARGAEAALYRSSDQKLYRDYVGKLRYKATDGHTEITLKPKKALKFHDDWDCINFWNYGAHWMWEPNANKAFRYYALIEDGNGKVHPVNFVQSGNDRLVHKYWFMNHIKLPENLPRPLKLVGILFRGDNIEEGHPVAIYLGPMYAYQETLAPLHFTPYPKKLPFPVRSVTILPENKNDDFKNTAVQHGNMAVFSYRDASSSMAYQLNIKDFSPLDITLEHNLKKVSLFHENEFVFQEQVEVHWQVQNTRWQADTLFVEATAETESKSLPFNFYYTIRQKSLIIGMDELSAKGHVTKVALGKTGPLQHPGVTAVPFLNFDYKIAPAIAYDKSLFYFMQFDWYYSDASTFYTRTPQIEGDYATHNGGVQYIPKTNGIRNPLHERLFVNVSDDVQEVLPTIPNPPSPMRPAQANRLWRINGNPNHEELKAEADKMRGLGIEQLTIRYHEGIWRDAGESYTFRLKTAPGRGGNAAVVDLVKYIKSKGWRVGLYSNYTDFAPVNAHWNEDWMMQGPKGEWKVSWARCFAPKPMVALEQEAYFAPKIHRLFGTNHSYCDVHTAISPMSRVDYDARVPGAATFRRTFECFGQLLLNEKDAYGGPVYSEGGNHWWYAGLVDGNYANAFPDLNQRPVFPDFQLLKLHPLEMDAGNTKAKDREYLAYTLAYGNIGICDGDESEMMKRYYMLQPLQPLYVMVPVNKIAYEHDGDYYSASAALRKGLMSNAHLKISYVSGLVCYINFDKNPWHLTVNDKQIILPQYGLYAASQDEAVTALCNTKVDMSMGPNSVYFDSRGRDVQTVRLAGNGSVAMKKEAFGWEIIPARDFEYFAFDPSLLDVRPQNIVIEGVDENDLPVERMQIQLKHGKVWLRHQNKNIFKYRILPAYAMIGTH